LLGRQVLDIMNSQLFMFNSFVIFHTSALYNSASAFISKEEIQSLSYQKHSISSPFPCPLTYHEPYAPSIRTVNQLRPQDIDIVASIGDSISAGTGALASNIFEVLNENRGSSFVTGSDGSWQTCPSIYNFVKQYNPHVQGGSHGSTHVLEIPFKRHSSERRRGLNLSVTAATAENVFNQAKRLVKKVSKIPGWRSKWKLVSLLIGHNDLCLKSCFGGSISQIRVEPEDYERNIRKSLNYLSSHLPNTLVVLMSPADVTMVLDLVNKPLMCSLSHLAECPCLFGTKEQGAERKVKWLWNSYRSVLSSISQDPAYNRNNFTVEYFPTLATELPTRNEGGINVPNLDLLAPDCFHFNKDLHGRIGRNLWNNLFQPVGFRTVDFNTSPPLACPSHNIPYISTKGNTV